MTKGWQMTFPEIDISAKQTLRVWQSLRVCTIHICCVYAVYGKLHHLILTSRYIFNLYFITFPCLLFTVKGLKVQYVFVCMLVSVHSIISACLPAQLFQTSLAYLDNPMLSIPVCISFLWHFICVLLSLFPTFSLPSVIYQTNVMAQQHVGPPHHLTLLTNR